MVNCIEPIDIYWNISNPIFSGGFGDHYENIIEVNRDTHPWEYDQVNIFCPSGINSTERHIIYSVDKMEYDNCRITNPEPRIIAVCDQPRNFMYFTITFRSFSPSPQQMEFKPGHSYYFISTSSDRDIHRRVGGWCSTRNMKMIFRVAENPHEQQMSSNQRNHATAFWSKYWNNRIPKTFRNSDYRDVYQHEQSLDYPSYEDHFKRDHISRDRKSRLDARHVQMPQNSENYEDSTASRLRSNGSECDKPYTLLMVLVTLLCSLRL